MTTAIAICASIAAATFAWLLFIAERYRRVEALRERDASRLDTEAWMAACERYSDQTSRGRH